MIIKDKHKSKESFHNPYFLKNVNFSMKGRPSYSYCHKKHHFDILGKWVGLKNFAKMTHCLPSGRTLFWSDLLVAERVVSWKRWEGSELGRWERWEGRELRR